MTRGTQKRGSDLIKAAEVAEYFGCCLKQPGRWDRSGKLPADKRTPAGHRRWLRRKVVEAARRWKAARPAEDYFPAELP